ncbi:MAG: ribonuclease J [Pseudomonadota bacterium]
MSGLPSGLAKDGPELVFLPLGGCGEIGMNLNVYGVLNGSERRWLIVDLGITFPGDGEPGVDVILPDTEFLETERENIEAIVLTHAHEDHFGAIPYLWDRLRVPVYATPFTKALLGLKLEEGGRREPLPIHEVPLSGRIELGPFDVEFVSMTHSIPEPNALAIRTGQGLVLHTGDWKLDPEPMVGERANLARLQEIGSEGVRALICDSTNVFSGGRAGSEAQVRERLTEIVAGLSGRVAVTGFASNVARMDTVAAVARATGRQLVMAGRAMHRVKLAAEQAGYLRDFPVLVPDSEAGYLPNDTVLYFCTGSQGEPRAALARIASGDHPHITLGAGDTVIYSSKTIPGNEREISHIQNLLTARGVDIIDEETEGVHVSGHPCRDELTDLYNWVRPALAVPVHGERRHIAEHVALAKSCGVEAALAVANGDLVRLAPGTPMVVDEVPHGRLHVDGEVIVPAGSTALRERRKLSHSGVIIATLVLGSDGNIAVDPMVLAPGLPNLRGQSGRTLIEVMEADVENALLQLGRSRRDDDDAVEEATRRALRGRLKTAWNKRPVIEVQIIRLDD